MVDLKLQKIISRYNLKITTELNEVSGDMFMHLIDLENTELSITIQFNRDRIYCIYFFNNQYFEIDPADYYIVINSILSGGYAVRSRGFLKKIKYIDVKNEKKFIYPERVSSDENFQNIYKHLPKHFSLKSTTNVEL